jgi:putative endonuclease
VSNQTLPYYVYVLQCVDGSYYTGYTQDLDNRVRLHMNGNGARYTRIHKPKRLVHSETYKTRSEAMKRERRLKTLSHRQKAQLFKPKPKRKKNA